VARWALEGVANPSVLLLHVDAALTDETIVTCPPAVAPEPVDRLLEIGAVRSLDVHRHRVRLNLRPDAEVTVVAGHADEVLAHVWGPSTPLVGDPGPRAFEARTTGPRTVAESPRMADGNPLLEALFTVPGVAEAIVAEGLVLVRLGRMFSWSDTESDVIDRLERYRAAIRSGMPGSTSGPSYIPFPNRRGSPSRSR
jgi:hypothetical protein